VNTRLTKLQADPEYFYKGILYSEGIIDMSIKSIPKKTLEDTHNGTTQFKKCLFLIENLAEVEYSVLARQTKIEVQTKKAMRSLLLEKNDH
jgi:hypothetical protein